MDAAKREICLRYFDLLDSYCINQAYERSIRTIIHAEHGVWIDHECIDKYELPEVNYQRWVRDILPRFRDVEQYNVRLRLPRWLDFDGKKTIGFGCSIDGLTYTNRYVIAILAYVCNVFLPFENCRMENEIWDARKETTNGVEIKICDFSFELIEYKNGKIKINGLTPDMADKVFELVELCNIRTH